MAHGDGFRPIAQTQAEGIEQDGLAGTGLAREHGHACGELQFEPVHDGEVADVQVREHVLIT